MFSYSNLNVPYEPIFLGKVSTAKRSSELNVAIQFITSVVRPSEAFAKKNYKLEPGALTGLSIITLVLVRRSGNSNFFLFPEMKITGKILVAE